MRRSLLTPKRLLAIIAALLVVSSLLSARAATAVASVPRTIVSTAIAPANLLLYNLSRTLRGPGSDTIQWGGGDDQPTPDQVRNLHQELGRALRLNEKLRQQNNRLKQQITQLSQIREQFGLSGMRLVSARVTAYAGDANAPVITIDRGGNVGITKGTVIASGFNLVGEVVHAGPLTADVKLITAKGTKLQVRFVPPRADAKPRLQNARQLSLREDGRTFGVRLSTGVTVETGDLAHLADPRWPREARGFVVGQVSAVGPYEDDPLSFQSVVVDPIPPLTALNEVTALVPME